MILDPLTQVLMFVALMPTMVLRYLLGLIRTRWYWRVLPTIVFLAISGLAVAQKIPSSVGYLSHWALNVWVFLVTADVLDRQTKPNRQMFPILCLATFWAIEVRLIFIQGFIQEPGTVHFWFLDYFNKLVLVTLEPTLVSFGLEEAMPTVLHYLSGPLVFLSNHLVSLHFWFSALGAYLVYRLIHPQIPGATRPLPLCASPLSRPFILVTGLLTLAYALLAHHVAINLLWQVAAFWLVFRGLRLIHTSAGQTTHRWALRGFWLGLVVLTLHPTLFWIPGILASIESFGPTRLGPRRPAASPIQTIDASEVVLGKFRRSFRAMTFFAVVIPMSIIPYIRTTARAGESAGENLFRATSSETTHHMEKLRVPDPAVEKEKGEAFKHLIEIGQQVQALKRGGEPIWLDVFEYPNRAGKLPQTGHSPIEAMGLCRANGKHLCSSEEWYDACSEAGRNLFLFPDVTFRSATKMLASRCNLASGLNHSGLLPSGAMDRCRGKLGAYDLVGNAFEWVRISPEGGFWGLAGSYYRYSDDQTISCPFRVVVHETQLDMINMDAVGFRCCRSKAEMAQANHDGNWRNP